MQPEHFSAVWNLAAAKTLHELVHAMLINKSQDTVGTTTDGLGRLLSAVIFWQPLIELPFGELSHRWPSAIFTVEEEERVKIFTSTLIVAETACVSFCAHSFCFPLIAFALFSFNAGWLPFAVDCVVLARWPDCPPNRGAARSGVLIPVSVAGTGVQVNGGVEQNEKEVCGTPWSDMAWRCRCRCLFSHGTQTTWAQLTQRLRPVGSWATHVCV